MHTLTTKVHRYNYSLVDPEQKATWKKVKAQLESSGVKHMHAWGDVNGPASLPDNRQEVIEDVVIDLSHIFGDQWNTVYPEGDSRRNGKCDGERLHDWYQFYEVRGRKSARGHWLEVTPEMEKARTETFTCGYCGKLYGPFHGPIPEDKLCRSCLDSPYLKQGELYLLELLPAKDSFGGRTRRAMPDSFVAEYVSRQTTGADSRAKARRDGQRAKVLKEYEDTSANATTERDGMLWLWDRGVDLENVIFYNHTQTFCYGWRSSDGPDPTVAAAMSQLLEGEQGDPFPFKWQIAKAKR